jgi:predicted HD superfamily hydrolase involved in NAD metabolism
VTILQTNRADEFLAALRARQPERTVTHVLGVAGLMERLTPLLGLDPDDAAAAALLHDLCKGWKPKAYLAEAERRGIEMEAIQRENPKLLHGPIAAETARQDFGVESEAVHEAIWWHTTGKPGMGHLALALYFADYSEPNRERPEAAEARRLLEAEGFWPALRYAASKKWQYVQTKRPIDPHTQAFYAWLTQGAHD